MGGGADKKNEAIDILYMTDMVFFDFVSTIYPLSKISNKKAVKKKSVTLQTTPTRPKGGKKDI